MHCSSALVSWRAGFRPGNWNDFRPRFSPPKELCLCLQLSPSVVKCNGNAKTIHDNRARCSSWASCSTLTRTIIYARICNRRSAYMLYINVLRLARCAHLRVCKHNYKPKTKQWKVVCNLYARLFAGYDATAICLHIVCDCVCLRVWPYVIPPPRPLCLDRRIAFAMLTNASPKNGAARKCGCECEMLESFVVDAPMRRCAPRVLELEMHRNAPEEGGLVTIYGYCYSPDPIRNKRPVSVGSASGDQCCTKWQHS